MKGDFTRDSFEPRKHYSRVLQQQGRVQIDSDWNEQVSILWERWRTLARDLIGPHAGPEGNCGFGIIPLSEIDHLGLMDDLPRLQALLKNSDDFLISPGHYYVGGILCVNYDFVPYSDQPDFHSPVLRSSAKFPFLIYLDVWERHISWAEDDAIREVALGGLDTTSRAKLVWQVRHMELTEPKTQNAMGVKANWGSLVQQVQAANRGLLRAKAKEPTDNDSEPCITAPQSKYRGPENQLYRVEIHRSGPAATAGKDGATFKWSRENGSVIFPIAEPVGGKTVTLSNLGRDVRSALEPGDWIEIVDDDYLLHNRAEPLLRVEQVIASSSQVILSGDPPPRVGHDPKRHPYLRRWDQREPKVADFRKPGTELHEGAVVLREGDGDRNWITLEDGVQVQFNPASPHQHYRTGDYWLIPARVATGDVQWPTQDGKPAALPPHGITHYYAPLAILEFKDGNLTLTGQCRMKFSLPVSLQDALM
jgi:Family of unknown function (DUF6519)